MKKNTIRLTDSFKHYTYDQDKACTPEETVARFKNRLSEINLDILKEVQRIDNGRLDIPVYFSLCGKDAHDIIGNKKQMGKGSTPEQSRASACMELAERFSFFSFKKNPDNFLVGTYKELAAAGRPVLPVEQLLRSVHDTITTVDQLENLLDGITMQWTWARNLTRDEDVLIPFSWFFAINEFNGPAAGNSYEEAVIQGLSEIIERHVCAVIDFEKRDVPLIDPDSATDPVAKELIEKYRKNGIEFYLNDFTLDTGIPTVGAFAIDRSTFPDSSEIVFTAGTTPNPEKALIRALTEVAQLAGDFNTKSNYEASGLPKPLSMDEVAYLTTTTKKVRLSDMPDLSDSNMKVEIENCLAALKNLEMDVFVINTMHPELKVPAIYTIVPGAHFRERSRGNNAGLFAAKLVADTADDPFEAIDRLTAMKDLLPGTYFIEFYLGRSMAAIGRYDEALTYLRKALDLNPSAEDIPYIYSYMGDCLKDMGRYEEAIEVLTKGTSLDDERPDLHNMLGFCHFKLEKYETAIKHFRRTVDLNPASAIDYANLGVNYRRIGKTKEAADHFELALSLDPGIEFARDNLAQLQAEA